MSDTRHNRHDHDRPEKSKDKRRASRRLRVRPNRTALGGTLAAVWGFLKPYSDVSDVPEPEK